jgi:hypothetical protein
MSLVNLRRQFLLNRPSAAAVDRVSHRNVPRARAELHRGTSGANAAAIAETFPELAALAVMHPAFPKQRLDALAANAGERKTLTAIAHAPAADEETIRILHGRQTAPLPK